MMTHDSSSNFTSILELLSERLRDNTHAGIFLVGSTDAMRKALMELATEIAAPQGDAGDRLVPLDAPYVREVYRSNVLSHTDTALVHATISVVRIDTEEEAEDRNSYSHLTAIRQNERIAMVVIPPELLKEGSPLHELVRQGAYTVLRFG